ncbi:MAG: hypothetical protein ACT4OG_06795 [Alphaproteobacteria bacterium]
MRIPPRPIPRPAIDVDVSEIGPGRFMAVARGLGITVKGVNVEHDMALALKRAGVADGPMATWRGDTPSLQFRSFYWAAKYYVVTDTLKLRRRPKTKKGRVRGKSGRFIFVGQNGCDYGDTAAKPLRLVSDSLPEKRACTAQNTGQYGDTAAKLSVVDPDSPPAKRACTSGDLPSKRKEAA